MPILKHVIVAALSITALGLSNSAKAFDEYAIGVIDTSPEWLLIATSANKAAAKNEPSAVELYKGFCRLNFLWDWQKMEVSEYEKQAVQELEHFLKFPVDNPEEPAGLRYGFPQALPITNPWTKPFPTWGDVQPGFSVQMSAGAFRMGR